MDRHTSKSPAATQRHALSGRGKWDSACLLWLAVLLLTVSCARFPRRGPVAQDVIIARQLSQQGMDALHDGSISEAEARFRQAIERCPNNTTARYHLANCLWKRGARKEAIEQLATAIEFSDGDDVEMMVELGYMWANVGQFDEALDIAERSIRGSPQHAAAWQLHGDVLRHQSHWNQALASYHRSLTYDPSNIEVSFSVAEIYSRLTRPDRLLATLNSLDQRLPPEHMPEHMLVLKSEALEQLKRYDEAVEVLAGVERQRGLSHDGTVRLVNAMIAAGQYGEAQSTIGRALSKADGHQEVALRQLLTTIAEHRARRGESYVR